MQLEVHVDTSGPIFTHKADRIAAEAVDAIQDSVGKQAISEVHQILDVSIRNPTPYYETQIIKERVASDVVVHDRGIVYGPWLEGISERNRTTRFKGYFSFRRATHRVRLQVPAIADRELRGYLPRMGGKAA